MACDPATGTGSIWFLEAGSPELLGDLGTKGDAGDEAGKDRACSLREARAELIDRSGVPEFHPCFQAAVLPVVLPSRVETRAMLDAVRKLQFAMLGERFSAYSFSRNPAGR